MVTPISGNTQDHPDGASQMDQDGSLRVEGREMGDPKHVVGQQRCGSGVSANRVSGPNSGRHSAARATDFYSIGLCRGRGCFCVGQHMRSPQKSIHEGTARRGNSGGDHDRGRF